MDSKPQPQAQQQGVPAGARPTTQPSKKVLVSTAPASGEKLPGARPSAPQTKKVGIDKAVMEGAAGSRPSAPATKKVGIEKTTDTTQMAGGRPQTKQTKKVVGLDSMQGAAGSRPSATHTKKVSIDMTNEQQAAGARGGVAATQRVNLGRSDRMQGIMHDSSVKVDRPVKQANNVADIEGARPANRHRARPSGMGSGLKGDDLEGAKPANKQFAKRTEVRNPLEAKTTTVAESDAPILGGPRAKAAQPKAFDASRNAPIKQIGFGGRMKDTLDCSEQYQGKQRSQKNLQPFQKAEIEGTKPKRLFQAKHGSGDFSGLNVGGIEGATPKRFHGAKPLMSRPEQTNEGAAGARLSAPASIATYQTHKAASASSLVFGGGSMAQTSTPPRRNPNTGPANPARYSSGGMAGVLGGADYGARSRNQPLNAGTTGSSSKTYQSSGVANSIFHS